MSGGPRRKVFRASNAVLLALAPSVSLALLGAPALGGEIAGRVVVFEAGTSSPEARRCLTRVVEELTAGGFAVETVDPGPGADPVSLAAAMRDESAATAVIALVGELASGAAELWILDRIGRQAEVHRIAAPLDDPEHLPEVLAIRTIEALRASALKMLVESSRPAVTSKPARPAALDRAAESEPASPSSRFGLETGISVLESIDGPGPAALPFIRSRADLARRLFVRLGAAGLGSRPVVTRPIGSATVSQAFGLLELGLAFRPGQQLRPQVTVGGGALHVDEVGQGVTPFQGNQASRWSAMADAGAGLSVVLGPRLALAAEAHVLLAFPYPLIRFEDTTAAEVGRPALLGSLSLVAWL